MTLVAAFTVANYPCLIADCLVSGGSGDVLDIPTHDSLLIKEYADIKICAFSRKSAIVSRNFVVAGVGDADFCVFVIDKLFQRFEDQLVSRVDVTNFLANIVKFYQKNVYCRIVGWIIERSEKLCFVWDSRRPLRLQSNCPIVEGSGANLYSDLIRNMRNQRINRNFAEAGLEEALIHQTITLYTNELLNGSTLLNGFGVGYDLYYFTNHRFSSVKNVTYLFYSAEFQKSSGNSVVYRFSMSPIIIKSEYIAQGLVVRSIIPKNFLKIRENDHIKIVFGANLQSFPNLAQTSVKFALHDNFSSDIYGVGVIDISPGGAGEVFSAVVSLGDAKKINIGAVPDLENGRVEIKTEVDGVIMSNIFSAAVAQFERNGTRLRIG